MRTDTKKFKVLEFIGSKNGVRPVEVEKFIVEQLQGRVWNSKKRAGTWNLTLYGFRGGPSIYKDYCYQGMDNKYRLTSEMQMFMNTRAAMLTENVVVRARPTVDNWSAMVTPTTAGNITLAVADLQRFREYEANAQKAYDEANNTFIEAQCNLEIARDAAKVARINLCTLLDL